MRRHLTACPELGSERTCRIDPWAPPKRSQYVSIRYTERLKGAGLEPSIGSVGDSSDNCQWRPNTPQKCRGKIPQLGDKAISHRCDRRLRSLAACRVA